MYFYEKVHSWWSRTVEQSICDIVVQNDGRSGPEVANPNWLQLSGLQLKAWDYTQF